MTATVNGRDTARVLRAAGVPMSKVTRRRPSGSVAHDVVSYGVLCRRDVVSFWVPAPELDAVRIMAADALTRAGYVVEISEHVLYVTGAAR